LPTNHPEERSGREVRLLVLVIVIAVAGLLVLARYRFPAADIVTVSPTPTPLERLTTRPPFDELEGAVAGAAARVSPSLAVAEFDPIPPEPPAKNAKAEPPPAAPRQRRPALRVGADTFLAYAPSGTTAVLLGGQPAQGIAGHAARRLVLVGAAPAGEGSLPGGPVADFAGAASGFAGSSYVLAVEAAAGGPAVRPIFVPRVDAAQLEPWDMPVLLIGGTASAPPGTFLFTLDGRLIGLTVPHDTGVAIVAAAALDRLVNELAASGGQ
jgi:hypothetical protein